MANEETTQSLIAKLFFYSSDWAEMKVSDQETLRILSSIKDLQFPHNIQNCGRKCERTFYVTDIIYETVPNLTTNYVTVPFG